MRKNGYRMLMDSAKVLLYEAKVRNNLSDEALAKRIGPVSYTHLSSVRGCVAAESIYKSQGEIVAKKDPEEPKPKTTRRKTAAKAATATEGAEAAEKPARKRRTTAAKSGLKVVEKKED